MRQAREAGSDSSAREEGGTHFGSLRQVSSWSAGLLGQFQIFFCAKGFPSLLHTSRDSPGRGSRTGPVSVAEAWDCRTFPSLGASMIQG